MPACAALGVLRFGHCFCWFTLSVLSAVLSTVAGAEVGLAGHWKFDETGGLEAADASGNGNAGTLTNTSGTVWVAGQVDGALSLDGANDIVVVADSDSLDLGNTFTIAAWINPRSYANYGRIVAKGTVAGSRYDLALASSGFQLKTSADYNSPTGLIALNAWQHVAVTYDGTTLRTYVQGVERASVAIALSITANTAPLYIGNVAALSRPFDGSLDDVRLYDRALSLMEVQALAGIQAATPPYTLAFSTYLGGSNWEHARDLCLDKEGNVYVVGGTGSANFPVTAGAYSTSYNAGVSTPGTGTGSFGTCDGFVAKFNASGQLVWCTYLGGPAYDRIYSIELDAQGYVYVSGRAGPGFPVTAGAFQTTFAGTSNPGNYGSQNGFVAKLSPDGAELVWATYVGTGELVRDLDVDADGDIYAVLSKAALSSSTMPPAFANAFANAVRATPVGTESGIVKIKGDGTQVLWATWLGGSGSESGPASIRVDAQKRPHIAFYTNSTDVPTAGAGADTTANGGQDMFVAAVNASGSALIFGTYLGGSGDDVLETHSLTLDASGNAYVMSATQSANWPLTAGTVGTALKGASDIGLAKIAPDGGRVLSTLLGGTGGENPDGIHVDENGRIILVAESNSTNFPVTAGTAFQAGNGGNWDGIVAVISPDFTQIEYATYLGGSLYDNGRACCIGRDGSIYLAGGTLSTNLPVLRATQAAFGGGSHPFAPGSGDCILSKFCPTVDRDGDGQTGIEEFVAGTNDADRSDVFAVGAIAKNGPTFDTTVAGLAGRRYILELKTDLLGSPWAEVTRTGIQSGGQVVTLSDPNAPLTRCFYRIKVEFP